MIHDRFLILIQYVSLIHLFHFLNVETDKKKLGKKIKKMRRKELKRANEALLSLTLEKEKHQKFSLDNLISASNLLPDYAAALSRKSHSTLTSKLTNFKLPKLDSFAPPIRTLKKRSNSLASMPLRASLMVQDIKL